MFNESKHYDLYIDFKHQMDKHEVDAFCQLLGDKFDSLCAHRDELRMLFYLAVHAPRDMFELALRQYYAKRKTNIVDFTERLPVLIHALNRYAKQDAALETVRIEEIQNELH